MENFPSACLPYTPAPTASPLNPTLSPTLVPTIWTCTDFVYWSEEAALSVCPQGSWGATDKGFETMMACDDTLQISLQDSFVNRLFKKCDAWCIYDLEDPATMGFTWRNGDSCWKRVTQFTCFNDDNIVDAYAAANVSLSLCPKTVEPTPQPTPLPTTAHPTVSPTKKPTPSPTTSPSNVPTDKPSTNPTSTPTLSPTTNPTPSPTVSPSFKPTPMPTDSPSSLPSAQPSSSPTPSPTDSPSASPTETPTTSPTTSPTPQPSTIPTYYPSATPSRKPTRRPTSIPTGAPTRQPTLRPTTLSPTKNPTSVYTHQFTFSLVHDVNLDQLSNLAISIGNVLGRQDNEVGVMETYIISYERRRLITSSTEFVIFYEDKDSATNAFTVVQTNLFLEVVKENLYESFGLRVSLFLDTVSSPTEIDSQNESNYTMLIIIAAAVGGFCFLLSYLLWWKCRKKMRKRVIQKQVTEMFSAAPGTYSWNDDFQLPHMHWPSDSELDDFDRDFMAVEGEGEGFTTMGAYTDDSGGVVTDGRTFAITEGDRKQRHSQKRVRGHMSDASSSFSESESGSSSSSKFASSGSSKMSHLSSPRYKNRSPADSDLKNYLHQQPEVRKKSSKKQKRKKKNKGNFL